MGADLGRQVYLQIIRDAFLGLSGLRHNGNLPDELYLRQIRDALLGCSPALYGDMNYEFYLQQFLNAILRTNIPGHTDLNDITILRQMLNAVLGPSLTHSDLDESEYFNTIQNMMVLPQNLIYDYGNLVEDFETNTNWLATTGSFAMDGVHVKHGVNAISVASVLGGNAVTRKVAGLSLDASSLQTKLYRIWVYVDDIANVAASTTSVDICNDTGFGQVAWETHDMHTGWNLVQKIFTNWSVSGFTWTNPVRGIRFRTTANGGKTATLVYDEMRFGMSVYPAIVLTFDDGPAGGAYPTAYPYMKLHKMRGTMYVITGSMTAGNWNQLKEMDNYGWAICNHTKNHPNLTGLSVAAQLAELDGAKNDLIFNNMGRNALHVAYPGGAADANTYIAMANGGYLTGRVITVGSGDGFPALPCDYPYRFPMSKQFGNTVTLAQAKTWVDGIITNSRIGVGLFHSLIPGVPTLSTEWNISDFYALIDYIAAKGVAVLTIPQAWNLMSGPIVVEKTQ